ncbi:DUF1405 domain-containing protein [Halostella sp. PRR32]|uniref:DUF1405 domain-containing protein n=1 Tax=Halostella sp. PRR32 TaxID=3098147 RepID=UPI00110F6558|nr:DUF1405 domain-containing protein [Halostella sp. PRR32]
MRSLPERPDLPRYVAPVPQRLEDLGLRYAWVVVAVNLLGTVFGFWYYGFHPLPLSDPLITGQFAIEPLSMWPLVPDSPVATLFIALAVASWKLGESREWLNALAFFGCLKLGFWTPYVLLVFKADFSYLHWAMYNFLFWSHLAMVVQGFVLYRFADFPVRAVAVALFWYGLNDIVDYFVPILGTPHHTLVPAEEISASGVIHTSPAHEYAAAGAVVLTLLATFLSLATRVKKGETGAVESNCG